MTEKELSPMSVMLLKYIHFYIKFGAKFSTQPFAMSSSVDFAAAMANEAGIASNLGFVLG